jgi:hypothetical protein
VDACVAINLAATRRCTQILVAGGWHPILSAQAARESLWFLDEEGERQRIDLAGLEVAGKLEIWTPVDDELPTLLRLAATLGPGEAACLALGHSRGVPVATDDRAGVREAARLAPAVDVVSTSALVRSWAKATDARPNEVAGLVERVESGARFLPPPNDPHRAWWDGHRQWRGEREGGRR